MTPLALPLPERSPAAEDMGQAALDFVQRFELQNVLSDFEGQLRAVVREHRREAPVQACTVVELRRD